LSEYQKKSKDDAFAEKRFRFLVEWDPDTLTQADQAGWLPIHDATIYPTIQAFQSVFEYGIRYYPNKKGINFLFRQLDNGNTPFLDV
jgi:ankyrin repeat protein